MLPFLSITQHQRLIRASRAGVSAKNPPRKLQDDRQVHQGAAAPQSLQVAPRAAQAQETPPAGALQPGASQPQSPADGLKKGAAKAQRTKKSAQRTTYAAQPARNGGRQETPGRRPRLRNRMLTMPREQQLDEYDQETLDRMEMDLHPERIWQSTGPIHDCPCNAPKGKPCTCKH